MMTEDDLGQCNEALTRLGEVRLRVYTYSRTTELLWIVMSPHRRPTLHGVLAGCLFVHGSTLERTRLSLRRENEANQISLVGKDFCAIGTSFAFSELPKAQPDTADAAMLMKHLAVGIDDLIAGAASARDVQFAINELVRVASLFADKEVDHYDEIRGIVIQLAALHPAFGRALAHVSQMAIGVRLGPIGAPDPT